MFDKEVYVSRRAELLRRMKGESGVAVFLGNVDAPANYRGNDYKFRQDSTFLYFWGIDEPCFAAVLDLETGAETLYADDVDIDDIVWMGPQPSVRSKAELVGVGENAGSTQDGVSAPYCKFFEAVAAAKAAGRLVHFVPQSRYYNQMRLAQVLGLAPELVSSRKLDGDSAASKALVRAIVSMRLVKQDCEIEAIDDACDLGIEMHTIAREGCRPGVLEQEIVGRMEGITLSKGWGVSFTTILSQNGETLHNHTHHQIITPGRLLVVDAGAESNIHYASDFTRTYPCGGKFTPQQKEIYDLVHSCNEFAFSMVRPGITYRDVHIATVTKMLEGLKAAGLVSGDPAELAADGIGGLFMPHGLGHNMGLDVHDMEDYGEDYVGYDDDQKREGGVGLANLRMARRLVPGNVITDEPGIYFIPALIAQFKRDALDKGRVNYARLEKEYSHFGGIRLEDDVLVTPEGARRLGHSRLPIASSDIERLMEGRGA